MTDGKNSHIADVMERLQTTKTMTMQQMAAAGGTVAVTITLPFVYGLAIESIPRGKLSKHAMLKRILEDGIRRALETREIPESEGEPAIPFDGAN